MPINNIKNVFCQKRKRFYLAVNLKKIIIGYKEERRI